MYTPEQVLRARTGAVNLSEQLGEDFHRGLTPEAIVEDWCSVGWSDPAAMMCEFARHCPDAEKSKQLRDAGIPVLKAQQNDLAARFYRDEIGLDDAKREAEVDPLLDLGDLGRNREVAGHALAEIRRLAPVKAAAARAAGCSVAEIAAAYRVSRAAAYSLLNG